MTEVEAVFYILSCLGILLISQLSPGPDFVLVVRAALNKGWRAGAWLGAGIGVGSGVHGVLFCYWGTWLVEQTWSIYIIIAASLWLLYLAWKIFSSARRTRAHQSGDHLTGGHDELKQETRMGLFMQGLICNLLNAKFVVFVASIGIWGMERFAQQYSWYAPSFVFILIVGNIGGWILWSVLFQWKPLRSFYKEHEFELDSLFASLLALLAIAMMLSQVL